MLYDNAFSPFARKVRLALACKHLDHLVVDGLALANRDRLAAINGRVEVPAISHGDVVVIGSSDIIAYLERIAPEQPLYPTSHAEWAHARAWERCADTLIDSILINVSYWLWANRTDAMPAGLLDAARRDLESVYSAIERDLNGNPFLAGEALSIAEIALFPHLTSTRSYGLGYDAERYPRLHAWLKRLRALEAFAADLDRVKAFLADLIQGDAHERTKIFWRGDRLEWILARGHHDWLLGEIVAGRVLWPGLSVPGPMAMKPGPIE
jgi:glutathione S-transferase